MSNTHNLFTTVLRSLAALTLAMGISLTVANDIGYVHASLTGVGTNVLMLHAAAPATMRTGIPVISNISAYAQTHATDQMTVGILLILLGFCLHAFTVSHESHRVRITAVPRKKSTARSRSWFWMEMQI